LPILAREDRDAGNWDQIAAENGSIGMKMGMKMDEIGAGKVANIYLTITICMVTKQEI